MQKTIEEIRQHFTDRLRERYGIELSRIDYTDLCANPRRFFFKGVYKKTNHKSVGYIQIFGQKVLVLYHKNQDDDAYFSTAYPIDADQTDEQIMRVCFGQSSLLRIAKIAYKRFLFELEMYDTLNLKDIPSDCIGSVLFKDSVFCFPHALIEKYKTGEYNKWGLCRKIRDIIFERHPMVEMMVLKK